MADVVESHPLLRGLNPSQQRACVATEGPVLVLAGAGSGKTSTLTRRVALLLAEGKARPHEILVVTFTNKAARELRERLEALLPDGSGKRVWALTFHAFCMQVLRHQPPDGFTRDFTVLDASQSGRLLAQVAKANGHEAAVSESAHLKALKNAISNAKNAGKQPHELSDLDVTQKVAKQVWPLYQAELRRQNAMDFDDLLTFCAALLEDEVKRGASGWAQRFKYLMVDEYQDTNRIQEGLLRSLTTYHDNIFVVGDDDQCLYSWRGAEVQHILRFERTWGAKCTTVRLEDNYRSTPQIIEAANAVIGNNAIRHGKTLRPNASAGDPVFLLQFPDSDAEAAAIAEQVRRLIADKGVSPGEIAVVYRNNMQAKRLESELTRRSITYKLSGGKGLLERAVVQDLLSYLVAMTNPRARQSFERAASTPKRGIGEKSFGALWRFCDEHGIDARQAIARIDEVPISAKARQGLVELEGLLAQAQACLQTDSLHRALLDLKDAIGLEQALDGEPEAVADEARAALQGFISIAVRLKALPGEQALRAFLEQVSLQETAGEAGADVVQLMTVHSTKGLEFDYVFLTALEDRLFLHPEAAPEAIEEERRIFYVGMTRARKGLCLSFAERRLSFVHGDKGGRQAAWMPSEPLRFLDELPASVVRRQVAGQPRQGRPGRRDHRPSAAHDRRFQAPRKPRAALPPRPGARPQAPRARPDAAAAGAVYVPGQSVVHPKWGRGMVLADGGQDVTVRFAGGERRLAKAYANLKLA